MARWANCHVAHGWVFYDPRKLMQRREIGAFKMAYRHFGTVSSDFLTISLWSQLETD